MRPKRSTAACTAASADARLVMSKLDDEQVVSLADSVGHGGHGLGVARKSGGCRA